jgi:hypothetical protein
MNTLPKALASTSTLYQLPDIRAGFVSDDSGKEKTYHEIVKDCRYFWQKDAIAGTVINRLAGISVTQLRHKWRNVTPAEKSYWVKTAERLDPFIRAAALEFYLHGMAIPQYMIQPVLGRIIDPVFGRKKIPMISDLWLYDVEHIVLRKRPAGMNRAIYFRVPSEQVSFIQTEGKYANNYVDREGYLELVEQSPEFVRAVKNGQTIFKLNVSPLMRSIVSFDDYPTPYLRNALDPLQHKEYLKTLDRKIAQRAIDAIRQIKIGNDVFPADEDTLVDADQKMRSLTALDSRITNLVTPHTWEISWVFPPLDVLINEQKYAEPNADIFLALGFPRVLTVGETAKSNSSNSSIALLGPLSAIEEFRISLLFWVKELYFDLAELTGFTMPEPYLAPIKLSDLTALTQFALAAQAQNSLSRDTIAQIYGTTFDDELEKMIYEREKLTEAGFEDQHDTEDKGRV